ncbi:MAG: hypothetical protein HC890_19150 [Chloroflexaceae bacterium]|nr:hypothetical protein [Chloroflexaceae bacterium]
MPETLEAVAETLETLPEMLETLPETLEAVADRLWLLREGGRSQRDNLRVG